jgi:hypothetical protein
MDGNTADVHDQYDRQRRGGNCGVLSLPLADDGVVLHTVRRSISSSCSKPCPSTRDYSLAHAQHPVNLLDTQPMKDVRHQSLESHILYTGNVLGSFEILRGSIQSSLPCVINEVLQH